MDVESRSRRESYNDLRGIVEGLKAANRSTFNESDVAGEPGPTLPRQPPIPTLKEAITQSGDFNHPSRVGHFLTVESSNPAGIQSE